MISKSSRRGRRKKSSHHDGLSHYPVVRSLFTWDWVVHFPIDVPLFKLHKREIHQNTPPITPIIHHALIESDISALRDRQSLSSMASEERRLRYAFHEIENERAEVNIDALENIATALRDGLPCRCIQNADLPPGGRYNLIFYLQFADGKIWIARIPSLIRAIRPLTDPLSQQAMWSMISVMRLVDERTSIPVPEVYGFDVTCNNDLGRPFVFLQKLEGELLWDVLNNKWKEHEAAFEKIMKQWGAYSMELLNLKFDSIGSIFQTQDGSYEVKQLFAPQNLSHKAENDERINRGPFKSTVDYLLTQSSSKRYSSTPHPPSFGGHLRMSLVESFLPYFVDPRYIQGPFVLSHTDLDMQNILVDLEKGDITGIIDWDFAAVLPLQSHIQISRMLNAEFLPRSEFDIFEDEYPYILQFSRRFRKVYEESMVEAAGGLELSVDDILDKSLMYGLFEKAMVYMPNEKYLPALWNHVYGGDIDSQEKTRNEMREGRWAAAMADKWNVEIQGAEEVIKTGIGPEERLTVVTVATGSTRTYRKWGKLSFVVDWWRSFKQQWVRKLSNKKFIEMKAFRKKKRKGNINKELKSKILINTGRSGRITFNLL
jgi:Phosphotransferase enzyme family